MSASEYWDRAEQILSEADRWSPTWTTDTADELIGIGWAKAENREAIAVELAKHAREYGRDQDDMDSDCECGKWLEWDQYEWPDHVSAVLSDLNLLNDPDYVPPPPQTASKPVDPVPVEFQFPRRQVPWIEWRNPEDAPIVTERK